MHILALIGSLETNGVSVADVHNSMERAVSLLETPVTFWVIILAGIALSPWMVRPRAESASTHRKAIFGASALLFLAALLGFMSVRQQFISIYADFFASPEWLLNFPFQLGASTIGATLLVLAWYYVHPVAWLRPGVTTGKMVILKAFTPMILTFVAVGFMMVISVFMRLV